MGLTLLELIVVIVILGILSAIAIPTFLSIIDKSKAASAQQTLEAFAQDAWANSAITGVNGYTTAGVDAAAGDTNISSAAATGVLAAQAASGKLVITTGTTSSYGTASVAFSTSLGQVSVTGKTETSYAELYAAMPTASGACVAISAQKGTIPKVVTPKATSCAAATAAPSGTTTTAASAYTPPASGTTTSGTGTTTTTVPTGFLASKVSEGNSTTCSVKSTHTLWCWGDNAYGDLGNGTTTNSSSPVEVKTPAGSGVLATVTSVSEGALTTCATTTEDVPLLVGFG